MKKITVFQVKEKIGGIEHVYNEFPTKTLAKVYAGRARGLYIEPHTYKVKEG